MFEIDGLQGVCQGRHYVDGTTTIGETADTVICSLSDLQSRRCVEPFAYLPGPSWDQMGTSSSCTCSLPWLRRSVLISTKTKAALAAAGSSEDPSWPQRASKPCRL